MKFLLGQMRVKKYYENVACVKKWMDANKEAMDKEDEERNKWFADVLKKATDAEADALKILNSGGPPLSQKRLLWSQSKACGSRSSGMARRRTGTTRTRRRANG